MSKQCYTHLSGTDRATVSLGLTHGQIVTGDGQTVGASRQHYES